MTEPLKESRAVFPPGQQRAFIETAEKRLSIPDMARLCACSTRTIRDWRREKFAMQLECLQTLCRRVHIAVPKNISLRNRYSHVRRAGAKGARAVIKKYGRVPIDEIFRRKQWQKWWNKDGQFRTRPPQFYPQPIYKPRKSAELAEFIGTMMGDGGMHKYQAIITLHYIDDRKYIDFVIKRIRGLFHIRPALHHIPKHSVFNIVISRLEVVKYLHSLGLPIGNKVRQQFDIPQWIKGNKKFSIACVRGLVDTDGSVFTHKYMSGRKQYCYKKLSFCSHSVPLQMSVAKILAELSMSPRLTKFEVRLDSIADMNKYFFLIGSHNPKHLERYRA